MGKKVSRLGAKDADNERNIVWRVNDIGVDVAAKRRASGSSPCSWCFTSESSGGDLQPKPGAHHVMLS